MRNESKRKPKQKWIITIKSKMKTTGVYIYYVKDYARWRFRIRLVNNYSRGQVEDNIKVIILSFEFINKLNLIILIK